MTLSTGQIGRHYPCDPDAERPGGRLDDAMDLVHEQISGAWETAHAILEEELATEPFIGLQAVANEFLGLAGYYSLADFGDGNTRIRSYTESAANALVGRLQAARQPAGGSAVTMIIEDDQYRVPGIGGRQPGPAASDFVSALSLGLITRDPRLLAFLVGTADRPGFPLPVAHDYATLWALGWQQLHSGAAGVRDTLRAAWSAAADSSDEYAVLCAAPAIRALDYAATGSAAEFNTAIAEALQQHRKFWGTPERCLAPVGFVSWHLLGLAGFAADRGLPVTVESGYLPPALLDRGWTIPFAEEIIVRPRVTHDDQGHPLYPLRLGIDGLWELLPQ